MECNTGKEIALSLARLAANAYIAYGLRANKPKLSEAAKWQPVSPESANRSWRLDEILSLIDKVPINIDPNPASPLGAAQASHCQTQRAIQANLHARTHRERPHTPNLHARNRP